MPNLTQQFYTQANTQPTTTYIETGTYLGGGIRAVMNNYDAVHSIELAEKWYDYNVDQFKDFPHVTMHLGDTKTVLPELLEQCPFPVTVFLDAHYSGGTTAFGEEECPLLQELEILRDRPYDDIIIIDDVRLLGTRGECGAGPTDPIYPTMQYDWSAVTAEEIAARMKERYQVFWNENQQYTDGPEDQIILVHNPFKLD
jgi:hypothetical protein